MWKLTVRSPSTEPKIYDLKPGINLIGRSPECDIYVEDIASSRRHAELTVHPSTNQVTLRDLTSRNGTFVNHLRVFDPIEVTGRDTIRIGNCIFRVEEQQVKLSRPKRILSNTHPLTREVLLEALDQQAVLLYEVTRQLNTILDLPLALSEASSILQRALGADHCGIILADQFEQLSELGYPETIAREAIEKRSTVIIADITTMAEFEVGSSAILAKMRSVMCIPVLGDDELLALLYLYKTEPDAPPFDSHDLQLAVSISHQVALSIQRTRLMQEVQDYRLIQSQIGRYVSSEEAERLLEVYLRNGALPSLSQQVVTILITNIADSSSLVERLGAERFARLLERFYSEVSEVVFKRHGLVRLMGDGIMAIFDEALVAQKSQERAVRAGREIIERIKNMSLEDTSIPLVVGVGIASGNVIAGYVGEPARSEYLVMGDACKTADELQQMARPYRMLVDTQTGLVARDYFILHDLGEQTLPGFKTPQFIYEILHAIE